MAWTLEYFCVKLPCIVPSDSGEIEYGSNDQEASPSVGKNTGVVLVPSRAWKCVPIAISGGADILEVEMRPQWRSQNYFKGRFPMSSQLTFRVFTFPFPYFSMGDYLLLIRKESVTYMHGLALCLKDLLTFAQDLYLENSEFQSEIQTGASNRCKRVLEAVKLAYTNEAKQKSLSLPRKMALVTFGELLFAFSTKVNMLYLLYLTNLRCFHLLPIKQNCLQNTYPGTRILMTQVLLYLLLLLGLIWNCIMFM